MTIQELAQNAARLKFISCSRDRDQPGISAFVSVTFLFEDDMCLTLKVDENTDELQWVNGPIERDETQQIFLFAPTQEVSLLWAWPMTNQQGYFDALQLEFNHNIWNSSSILQFKVMASGIYLFSVSELTPLLSEGVA